MAGVKPASNQDRGRLIELLRRISLRDTRAFGELHRLTRSKLCKVVLSVGAPPAEIDDILQETYLKVWRNAKHFDLDRATAMTWMGTIARNTAIDAMRTTKPQASELDEALSVPAASEANVDEFDFARAEPVAALALARLPEDRRRLVALAYIEGESRAKLSQRFGVPINTIKTWLRRALESVREECLAAAEV